MASMPGEGSIKKKIGSSPRNIDESNFLCGLIQIFHDFIFNTSLLISPKLIYIFNPDFYLFHKDFPVGEFLETKKGMSANPLQPQDKGKME